MGTVTYNLEHGQVALLEASPTYLDIPGTTTLEATINSSVSYMAADGAKKYAAWSAPEGGGRVAFAEADFAVIAVLNGGTQSSSGTTPAIVDRYVQPGKAGMTDFILVGYGSNVNPTTDRAGFRVIIPQASAAPAAPAMGQETWGEWSASLAFTENDDGAMIIYETLESAPTFTGDVFTVTI